MVADTREIITTTITPPTIAPPAFFRRISWGAVLAGVFIAIIIHITMNMLGLAIGAGALDPDAPTRGLGSATVIWIAVSILLGLFAGAWVSSRLAGVPDHTDGILHGLLTWAVTSLLIMWFLSSAVSNVFNGITSALSQGIGMIGANVADVAPDVASALNLQSTTFDAIRQEATDLQTADGNAVGIDLPLTVVDFLTTSDPALQTEARGQLVTLLADQTGMTSQEATAQVERWEAQYQTVSTRVEAITEQAAEDIADGVAATAGIIFLILVLGAFAGGAGGFVGTPEEVETVAVATVS